MKITIENTDKIVDLDGTEFKGVPARIWEGQTESGVPVTCFVTRIIPRTHDEAVNAQFAAELREEKTPTLYAQGIPLRMFID
jgi:hypothetical protein